MKKYIVNHVMSRDINSGIFKAILGYFNKYTPDDFIQVESVKPIENADIYHYHRPHLESKLLGNSVCTVHHDLNDPDSWHSRNNFVPRYQESSRIVCLNTTQKRLLVDEEGLDGESIVVIPHGYNQDVLYPQNKKENKKLTIGIASKRYGRRVKGEAYLFELVKRLDPELVKFIFVGEDRSIDANIFRSWGFDVSVFERLPYRVFNGFYNEIDCLLMCSTHEGGPANIPEALATGTPILSTPIGMALDYITSGKNGEFLTLNPNIDAQIIMKLCLDYDYMDSMRKNCLIKLQNVLTWKNVVDKHIELYKSIIKLESGDKYDI